MIAEKTYEIDGMTCMNCVAKVKSLIEGVPGVKNADIKLEYPQGQILLEDAISLNDIQSVLGKYKISESKKLSATQTDEVLPEKSLNTYKPLIIILLFIIGVTALAQYPFDDFSAMKWMRHFMAGFFLVFSFFKILNIKGFADSYAMYDVVAGKWHAWGYIYPFVELGLGLLYLTNLFPIPTNIATVLVLGVSSIGVIKSVISKQKIKCACLGDVFNLPMSTVTIIEDLLMVLMALGMLVYLQA